MNANTTAYLVLVAAPSSAAPPLLPAGTVGVPRSGQFWKLSTGKNLIGRQPDPLVPIVLPWTHVSRRHAQIEWIAPGNWKIEDLQSRNGTSVNGQRLQPRSLLSLNDGDRIQITISGDIELLFCFQIDPAIAPSVVQDSGTPDTVYQ
jgi:pSer/pThr/pTyr-binding forkhead associated (FHA) protein